MSGGDRTLQNEDQTPPNFQKVSAQGLHFLSGEIIYLFGFVFAAQALSVDVNIHCLSGGGG